MLQAYVSGRKLGKRQLAAAAKMVEEGLSGRCPICHGSDVFLNEDDNWAYCNNRNCMVKWSRRSYRFYQGDVAARVNSNTPLVYLVNGR